MVRFAHFLLMAWQGKAGKGRGMGVTGYGRVVQHRVGKGRTGQCMARQGTAG